MFTIRKLFRFEMAHQLAKAFSRCCSDTIHGHTYTLEVFFKSEVLDETDMVVDFGEIKQLIKEYVESWDHSLVMPGFLNPEYLNMLEKYCANLKIVPYNPTAEAMSRDMFYTIKELVKPIIERSNREIKLHAIRLHETQTGYAEYSE